MRIKGILNWLEKNVQGMRKSRAKTLGYIVSSLIAGGQAGIHALGRMLPGKAYEKHKIKRVERFVANKDVEVEEISKTILKLLMGNAKRVELLMDWTDVGEFQKLVVSIPWKGRALPVASLTAEKEGPKARRSVEKKLLSRIAAWIPANVEKIIVADRGFAGVDFFRWLQKNGWHFVIRLSRTTTAELNGNIESLSEVGKRMNGKCVEWRDCKLTRSFAGPFRLIGVWKKNHEEPWFIATDLTVETKVDILNTYRRRMWIEAMFRDKKSHKWGFGLESVRLSEPERYDRLFIALMLGYLFSFAGGDYAERRDMRKHFQANTETVRQISLFRLGLYFLRKCKASLTRIINEFIYSLQLHFKTGDA